jgi:hypothetical protein
LIPKGMRPRPSKELLGRGLEHGVGSRGLRSRTISWMGQTTADKLEQWQFGGTALGGKFPAGEGEWQNGGVVSISAAQC